MCTTRISEYESGWELLEKLKVNKIGKFTGLYKVICLKEFLLIDYIKKGKFQIDKKTIDDTNFESLSLFENAVKFNKWILSIFINE